MKKLNDMSKKELSKLSKEQIKARAIKEMQEIISKEPLLTGTKLEVLFRDKKDTKQ